MTMKTGNTCCIITYGMGVYWSLAAAKEFPGQITIIDLRSLYPLDEDLIYEQVKRHGRCLVLTEESLNNSFAEALSGRIAQQCFRYLDAPVSVVGSLDLPAVPINLRLEAAMLPGVGKLSSRIQQLLGY